uniref:Uncharacterized protein n=1 Tax=Avena sativa TaxID=4498 RepID=A0ACD5ZCQ3_AVESA
MALARGLVLAAALSLLFFAGADAGTVGVNWGRVANDLPNPASVVQLLKQHGIGQVKLYDTEPTVLRALANSGIKVVVALPNEQVAAAARRPSYALAWVRRNVAAYYPATQIQGVAVGNEVFATAANVTFQLVPAMTNVHAALARLNMDKAVKVSSPIALTALAASYPPSAGVFREELSQAVMKPMLDFLSQTGSYLMVNAYPFFAYADNAGVISLDYALFRPNAGELDSGSGLKYYSLLDAQLDAVFSAVGKLGSSSYNGVRVVVSETGWPSKGDAKEVGASASNAAAYNGNLVRRVLSGNAGTPRRADADVDVYLFALFNENQKPGPTSERNYGVFYPNQQQVYDVEFVLGGRSSSKGNGGGGLGWQDNGNAPAAGGGGVKAAVAPGDAWCVANAMAGEGRLKAALDYACGPGGADCKGIQPGAACFEPNTMVSHASYAFNDYYQRRGRSIGTCDFAGAAYVVNQAPKMGKCELPSTV